MRTAGLAQPAPAPQLCIPPHAAGLCTAINQRFHVHSGRQRRKISLVVTQTSPVDADLASATVRQVLWIGPVAAGLALVLSLVGGVSSSTPDVPVWVLVIAAIALAAGIPHGAVDHLLLRSVLSPRNYILLGLAYLAIAAAATAAILLAPGPAFVVVIAMTVWHFGSGDVEAWRTLTHDQGAPRLWLRIILVLAAGGAPVVLPLTSPAAMATLHSLNPSLATWWSAPATTGVRIIILVAVVLATLLLLHLQRPWAAIQLMILAALGIFAAPLLAFAVYFGAWHALRHTARLAQVRNGTITWHGIAQVTATGLPALLGSVIFVGAALVFSGGFSAIAAWLWVGLALVWGLTVPHMVLVERFDRHIKHLGAVPQ